MLLVVLIMIFYLQSINAAAESKDNLLVYEGNDYIVELTYGSDAGISENAALFVAEIYEGSKEYQELFSQASEFMKQEAENGISYARFFDITILDGDKEIEPNESVNVAISYDKGIVTTEEENLGIVHFVENGEKEFIEIDKKNEQGNKVTKVSFEQDSFSVIGMIVFDGVDSDVKEVSAKIIEGVREIRVEKVWSDGQNNHTKDSVKIALCEMVSGDEELLCDELVLDYDNDWAGQFKDLDVNKQYSIKEIKVVAGNQDKTDSYISEITNTSRKEWCLKDTDKFSDGENILLIFNNEKDYLVRKSATDAEMNLRVTNVSLIEEGNLGKYCETMIESSYIWKSIWNEKENAWELFCEAKNAYLTLIFNETNNRYEWVTRKKPEAGSYLDYENGYVSATVNGVKKYLGNVSGNGPYEGVEKTDKAAARFQIYSYRIFDPGIYRITNTINEGSDDQEMMADVLTEKTIDFLGDQKNNPDTDIDDGKIQKKILDDLYRLNLNIRMRTDVTGLDLLLVMDVSSSMKEMNDSKDSNGNAIYRAEALRQALNEFIPEFLPENTKNRMAVVAFEDESLILNDWTQDSKEILEKVNLSKDGEMPLYNGEGTNYESALSRAHEALMKRGYSSNAKAMIFLSDGEPTVYLRGNDELEKGNVTINLGEASLTEEGISGVWPDGIDSIWRTIDGGEEPLIAANEAAKSFQKHHPEVMVGTIAFNTKVTDCLKNLATESSFVTQVENGTPDDLIQAMELITDYAPQEIVIVDELSENVALYDEQPDFKVKYEDASGNEKALLEEGKLTSEGKVILDGDNPVKMEKGKVMLHFKKDYAVENNSVFELSFNVRASQKAYDKYADAKGEYSEIGDEGTDYKDNQTSSGKGGFYSNGNGTKVSYSLNGAVIEKKYKQPVIQVSEGKLRIFKVDLDEKPIGNEAEFSLYRKADVGEENTVELDGIEDKCILVAKGKTNEAGALEFEHLRVAVFDSGYPYYLVETKAPDGYAKYENPIQILLYKDGVEVPEKNGWVKTGVEGQLIVKNGEYVEVRELPVTGGHGNYIYFLIGVFLITGGIIMKKNKRYSKMIMMIMTFLMAFQMLSVTAFAINKTQKGSIAVEGVESGVYVHAYRLMDINYDYEVDQPKNPMYMWVDEMADWVKNNYPSYININNRNEVKEEFSSALEAETALFYDRLAVAIKDKDVELPVESIEAAGDSVIIENLTMGNYFLLIEGGAKVYRPLTANVVPEWKENAWMMSSPTVVAKASEPVIEKTILGRITSDNADVGDIVSFELNAVIPVYPDNAKAKKYVISDKLSEGLTLVDGSIKVFGMNAGKEDELLANGYTVSEERPVGGSEKQVSFALDFNYEIIGKYSSLKVTYDTLLNEKAVVGETGNKNLTFLDYNNNPYVTSSWNVDSDETVIYTYGMKISKIDGDSKNPLREAEFTLSKDNKEILFTGENGVYCVSESETKGSSIVTTDKDGMITIDGLDEGIYYLTEVKAPNGYVKLQNPVEIVIDDKDMDGKAEAGGQELEDGYVPVTVENDAGFTLPVTGGMGTTIFHVAGVVLMGGGLLMITLNWLKRKRFS